MVDGEDISPEGRMEIAIFKLDRAIQRDKETRIGHDKSGSP